MPNFVLGLMAFYLITYLLQKKTGDLVWLLEH